MDIFEAPVKLKSASLNLKSVSVSSKLKSSYRISGVVISAARESEPVLLTNGNRPEQTTWTSLKIYKIREYESFERYDGAEKST